MARRVLLVDDEAFITDILGSRLRSAGFEVEAARGVAAGLALARATRPSLVVSDLEMPDGTGIDLADALWSSAETHRVPIILLTGRGHLAEAEASERLNIRAMVAKPFSARELEGLIREVLDDGRAGDGGQGGLEQGEDERGGGGDRLGAAA